MYACIILHNMIIEDEISIAPNWVSVPRAPPLHPTPVAEPGILQWEAHEEENFSSTIVNSCIYLSMFLSSKLVVGKRFFFCLEDLKNNEILLYVYYYSLRPG